MLARNNTPEPTKKNDSCITKKYFQFLPLDFAVFRQLRMQNMFRKILGMDVSWSRKTSTPHTRSYYWCSLGRCAFGIDTDLQNNPDNIYFKKIEEAFGDGNISNIALFKFAQLVPEIGTVLGQIFSTSSTALTFINTQLLPMISSTEQLHETPFVWLFNRLHTIVEQRQQVPSSRADLLELMLRVITKEPINVSKTF